jgi:hypothetical protein
MLRQLGARSPAVTHELHPAAKRVLLVERGDYSAAHPAVRAMAVGQIDYHLFRPWQPAHPTGSGQAGRLSSRPRTWVLAKHWCIL